MMTPSARSDKPADPNTVAENMLGALNRQVPLAVLGTFLLWGDQSMFQATENLTAMNQATDPWHVSSCARALQGTTLKTWASSERNIIAVRFRKQWPMQLPAARPATVPAQHFVSWLSEWS